MAEYIKLEAAIDAVNDVYYDTPDMNLSANKLEAALRGINAADVAPVVHGRMVETDRPIRDGKSKVYGRECTACKRFTRSPFVDNWNY